MSCRIKEVVPLENFVIKVRFYNGVEKLYDVKNLYEILPQFKFFEQNPADFEHIMVEPGGYGISWNDELDLEAEEIWEVGIPTGIVQKMDPVTMLSENLIDARNSIGMTQRQLSETTGIYQSDISKIERGLANPSLSTLRRLANGLGMELKIDFIKDSSCVSA